jgi:tripartite-type tricarboxylate transporter receptor subunit TctC
VLRKTAWYVSSGTTLADVMKLPRRQFLHLAAGAVALPALSRVASAEIYPTRAVHIIVGFAPGGSADILARLMGHRLSAANYS